MVKRLFVGLFLGAVIGAIVAAVLIQGMHIVTFTAVVAYLAAIVTGVICGLVAGKPIWSADGKIEAGLKAFFGGLLSLGGMWALRTWAHTNLDLHALNAGIGEIGALPAASLPLLAGVISGMFELDNTTEKQEEAKAAKDAKATGKRVRVSEAEEKADEDEEEESASAKKRR